MALCPRQIKNINVALLSMPWAPPDTPSIAIGLLKSILIEHGYQCQAFYLSIKFYESLGKRLKGDINTRIDEIVVSTHSQLYDWLFARKAFEIANSNFIEQYSEDPIYSDVQEDFELIIDQLAQQNWDQFDLIGFSCGFNQTISSLALSKKIKHYYPSIPIVLGGAAVDHKIAEQIIKNTPWIDTVFVGEAELVFPKLIPDVINKKRGIIMCPPLTVKEMSIQPFPNYDEFYQQYPSRSCSAEASRGCWYKNICSFCGMVPNGGYRTKKNLLSEINYLKDKYDISEILFGDLVFPTSGLKIFESTSNLDIDFHYSLRVDSINPKNMRQLKCLHEGGTKSVFVGIESLHPTLLALMNKNSLAINAISLLKWMKFYNIRLNWFLLYGVPGDEANQYSELLNILRKITHLHAPLTQNIVISRNSHYFHQFEKELSPLKSCRYIYPETFEAKTMSWFFERISIDQMKHQLSNTSSIRVLTDFLRFWRQSNNLSLIRVEGVVIDRRKPNKLCKYNLSDEENRLLNYCSVPQNQEAVQSEFDVENVVQNNLLIHLDKKYLSLVEPQKELACDAQLLVEN